MGPESTGPSEPGLIRMLRRRKRRGRMARSHEGKVFQSWGEYAPRTLQTTGDHSAINRWAYVAIFCGAILIVPLFAGLLSISNFRVENYPLSWKLLQLLNIMMPFLAITGLLVLSMLLHGAWLRFRNRPRR